MYLKITFKNFKSQDSKMYLIPEFLLNIILSLVRVLYFI